MEAGKADWRELQKTLSAKIQYLFTSAIFSDVILNVADGKTKKKFEAHSVFLKMASPVFEKELDGEWKEKSKEITIEDVDPEIFGIFLRFLYFDDVKLGSYEEAADLLKVADRFMVSPLVEICVNFLVVSKLDPSNALHAHSIGDLYHLDQLKEKARRIMIEQTKEVVSSPDFARAGEKSILSLLDEPALNMEEFDLFQSVEEWLNKQAEKENLIGAIVSKFRFFSMTVQEFSAGPSLSDMLTSEQKLAILINMINKTASLPLPDGLNKSPRSISPRGILNLKSHLKMDLKYFQRGPEFLISVDKQIRLEAFQFSTCKCNKVDTIEFTVLVYDLRNSEYISKTKERKEVNGVGRVKIKLETSCTLFPDQDYGIEGFVDHACIYETALLQDVRLHQDGVNFCIRRCNSDDTHLQAIHFKKYIGHHSDCDQEIANSILWYEDDSS